MKQSMDLGVRAWDVQGGDEQMDLETLPRSGLAFHRVLADRRPQVGRGFCWGVPWGRDKLLSLHAPHPQCLRQVLASLQIEVMVGFRVEPLSPLCPALQALLYLVSH